MTARFAVHCSGKAGVRKHRYASDLRIGSLKVGALGFLAPMSGVTDLPFRRLAHQMGAGLVISEMVASEALVRGKSEEMRAKASLSEDIRPRVIQLAGREARWMGEAAHFCADMGADMIDINMGCPAKKVTNGYSGSALMRDPDHALSLVAAVKNAVSLPVSVKMRLGWDHNSLNAAEIAMRCEDLGVSMISVHGRTRCQFYSGRADWDAIAHVRKNINIPLISNGDLTEPEQAFEMMKSSGADAVMIGRGAYGKPWLPGQIGAVLAGKNYSVPNLQEQSAIVERHYEDMLSHYGVELGVRCARKHLGWYMDTAAEFASHGLGLDPWKKKILRASEPEVVKLHLRAFYEAALERCAA